MIPPINKSISELDHTDISRLIGLEESKTLEFKRDAYTVDSKNRYQEFCKDISALANTNGGWLICGIGETDGAATEIVGLDSFNADKVIAGLQDSANNTIKPHIQGLDFRAIEMPSGAIVLVIYVPRSFVAPHLSNKFYIRRAKSVNEMDIAEIRAAFSASLSLGERVRQFRKHRVEVISQRDHDEIPIVLEKGGYISVIHLIPLSFDDPTQNLDIFSTNNPRFATIADVIENFPSGRYNFDGYVRTSYQHSYIQFFRNGAIEFVGLGTIDVKNVIKRRPYVSLDSVAKNQFLGFKYCLQSAKAVHTQPPFFLLASLIDFKGVTLLPLGDSYDEVNQLLENYPPITRNTLLLADIVVENYDTSPAQSFRPILDMLWNTAGIRSCPYYDEQGQWKSKEPN